MLLRAPRPRALNSIQLCSTLLWLVARRTPDGFQGLGLQNICNAQGVGQFSGLASIYCCTARYFVASQMLLDHAPRTQMLSPHGLMLEDERQST